MALIVLCRTATRGDSTLPPGLFSSTTFSSLSTLVNRTLVPVYLPTRLPKGMYYVITGEEAPQKYTLFLSSRSDCAIGQIRRCAQIEIDGAVSPNLNMPPLRSRRSIRLRNGATGFWSSHECTFMGCWSGFVYEFNHRIYAVYTYNQTFEDTVVLVNAMSKVTF